MFYIIRNYRFSLVKRPLSQGKEPPEVHCIRLRAHTGVATLIKMKARKLLWLTMEKEIKAEKPKRAGGRPKKEAGEKRAFLHSVWLSEKEEKQLQAQMSSSGLSAADLFRQGVLGGKLRIPKARIAPEEVMALLTDFKKKSSLIKLLAHRDRDFTVEEKRVLLGSSGSMRSAIERLERSLFLSLEKADSLQAMADALAEMEALKDVFKKGDTSTKVALLSLEKLLTTLKKILVNLHQYLSMQ